MNEQPQTTGIPNADSIIETARAAGLTVDVTVNEGAGYTGYSVRIGYVVQDYAKGTALELAIGGDWLSMGWYRSSRKGARGKLLSATWRQFTGSHELRTLKRAAAHVEYMAMEQKRAVAEQREREEQQQEAADLGRRFLATLDSITRTGNSASLADLMLHAVKTLQSLELRLAVPGEVSAEVRALVKGALGVTRLEELARLGRLVADRLEVEAQRQEAVSASVSAEERPGVGAVPVAAVGPCESTQGVPSGLLDDEERAAAEAELLVPRGERLALRVVHGMDDRRSVEERAFVVGVVACQLRAGARSSRSDGALVLRCGGETTVVELAA